MDPLAGAVLPGKLLDYLRRNRREYEAFLFYTYLYDPTAKGLAEVPGKSILIPTAHDERPIYLRTYRELFDRAAGLIFLTAEEQEFTNRVFGLSEKPQLIRLHGHPGGWRPGRRDPGRLRPARFPSGT